MALTFNDAGDAELSATLHNRRTEIIDNVFQGSPTLKAFRDFGGVVIDNTGGIGIVRPVIGTKNGTADSFSGFDTFLIDPQDNETSLNYPWASLWAHVAVAWDEETRNTGQAQLINLVNMKIDTAMMSIKDEFNIQLHQAQPAAASKDMNSLTELLDVAPSAAPARSDAIGGIDPATATWWRNVTDASGVAFGIAALRTVFLTASDGADPPSFLITNQDGYEDYEDSQVTYIRYSSGPVMDAGASDLLFKQTPVRWDPQMPTVGGENPWYGINTKYHKVVFHARGQFATQDFITADNGAYKVGKILVMAQQFTTNRRRGFFYSHT